MKPTASESQAPTALTASTPSRDDTTKNQAEPFCWIKDAAPGPQTKALCARLRDTGALYRTPEGDLLWLVPDKPVRRIDTPVRFEGFIRSHFPVIAIKRGKQAGNAIPATDLKILMATGELQSELPVVDHVTDTPTYTEAWTPTQRGYNDGPEGGRIYYVGKAVEPVREPKRIREFIDVIAFRDEADRTHAVALALTTMLRFRWPGCKPFGAVTANKYHGGKDTVVDFATGRSKRTEISWQGADWALQNEAVAALSDPEIGVLTLGNVRSQGSIIESAFIERIVTSPQALMQSSKRSGDGFRRKGDFVVCATANMGRFSPDLANRSLPIHIEQIGDIAQRVSPIGDPRHEFLPAHREEIEAEICGLIENWRDAGMPLDEDVRHPMREWARTIGGILKANGFKGFLANWSFQRSVNDSLREALALVADASPANQWLRVRDIVQTTITEGVVRALVESKYRESERSIERQLGVILTAHRDETLHLESDGEVRSYCIRKDRNDSTGQLATVYRFERMNTDATGA